MSYTKDQLILLAKYHEQAERYDDMRVYVKKLALLGDELSKDERNLFSVGYKNSVSARRKAYRVFLELEAREQKRGGANLELLKKETSMIESELTELCNDLLGIINKDYISKYKTAESQVFFFKMAGDYYRYMCEYLTGSDLETATQNSLAAYNEALKIAESLSHFNPIKLGLILNLSVFYYEITRNPEKAIQLSRDGFDNAIGNLEEATDDDEYKDATTIMQLIRDNLTLWTSEVGDDTENA